MSNPPNTTAAGRRDQPSNAEQTRVALIHAALTLFGARGFEGASTRDIAAGARANIGSIAYHFGGKEGLRAACAAYIVETVQGVAAQALATAPETLDADGARVQLEIALERMVAFIVARPEAGEIVRFLLRELSHPTSALDTIYKGVFEPVHARLCLLWSIATGEPVDEARTKITVFTLIGQVVYFRIGREAVMRRMGWTEIGPDESAQVLAVARDNLRAILASRTGGRP